MRPVSTLLAAVLLPALGALAGGMSGGREVPYPTKFKTVVTTRPDGSRVVTAIPTEFNTRRTGASLEDTRVGVAQYVGKARDNQTVYRIGFDDGPTQDVVTGTMFEINGHRYMALGPSGSDYLLLDLKSRRKIKLSRQDAAPAGGFASTGGETNKLSGR